YMYLDTNGDGVNSGADIISPTGITTVDVWLRTDANRDGPTTTCKIDGTSPMSISGYEFILHAVGGTVLWGSVANRMPFPLALGTFSNATDFYTGFLAFSYYPAGTHRLAT